MLKRIEGDDIYLTIPEVAALLRLSPSTIYKLSMRRLLPGAFKPAGKKVYFSRAAILEWIRSKPVTSAEQIEQRAVDYVTLGKGKPRRA